MTKNRTEDKYSYSRNYNEQANMTPEEIMEEERAFWAGGIRDENGQTWLDDFIGDQLYKVGIETDDDFQLKFNNDFGLKRYTPKLSMDNEGLRFSYEDNLTADEQFYFKTLTENGQYAPNAEAYYSALDNYKILLEASNEFDKYYETTRADYAKLYDDYMNQVGKMVTDGVLLAGEYASYIFPPLKLVTEPISLIKDIDEIFAEKNIEDKLVKSTSFAFNKMGDIAETVSNETIPKVLNYTDNVVDLIGNVSKVMGPFSTIVDTYDLAVNESKELDNIIDSMKEPFYEYEKATAEKNRLLRELENYQTLMEYFNPIRSEQTFEEINVEEELEKIKTPDISKFINQEAVEIIKDITGTNTGNRNLNKNLEPSTQATANNKSAGSAFTSMIIDMGDRDKRKSNADEKEEAYFKKREELKKKRQAALDRANSSRTRLKPKLELQ